MILIADAAPLIFLAKINQLPLLTELFKPEILVPLVVRNEVLGPDVPPDEERSLTRFISGYKLLKLRKPTNFAKALSFADNCILTLAIRERTDFVLSDDRLLRKTAVIEGPRVIGTIGVLLRATKASILTPEKSIMLLDELVEEHNFRVAIKVYEASRKAFCSA